MRININNSSIVKFTNILEKLKKSALPVAIRGTLNDAVFNVKTDTMPNSANKEFTVRQKNFFVANSKFEPAKGLDIGRMQATVGFYENKLTGNNNYAVKDLEQQEKGGAIDGKTFVPTVLARRGRTNRGLVKPNYRIKAIRGKGIVNADKMKGKFHKFTKAQQFIAASRKAGPGGYVLYNNLLLQVNSIDGKQIDASPIYTVRKGRSVSVKATNFMAQASLKSAEKLDDFYLKQADRQVKKYYGKL